MLLLSKKSTDFSNAGFQYKFRLIYSGGPGDFWITIKSKNVAVYVILEKSVAGVISPKQKSLGSAVIKSNKYLNQSLVATASKA